MDRPASTNRDTVCFLQRLAQQPAVLVSVSQTQGSTPREEGAWMAVFADGVVGTIGGGHLEWQACEEARALLAQPEAAPRQHRYALGPSLGQCCGGIVYLRLESVGVDDTVALERRLQTRLAPVALFGGGHVGHALVQALAPLPFAVHWIDSRDGIFPDQLSGQIETEHSDPVQSAVPLLAPSSRVLIMSFSHAEDLDIVAACLQRQREQGDLPFVGLIGSKSKWAAFRHRLEARGYTEAELAHVTCPIGLPGISGKEPDVIAASVAAQLLMTLG